jgi:hypothetical protein
MSLVKVSGNASGTGTLTIAAPNTNTDYTLTLPQATDTLAGIAATQTLTNKTLTSPTLTTPNIDSAQFATVVGTAPIYPCRAWVEFNGTGTIVIRASGNVSSITDNGAGDYTVNFTTSMSDANYSAVGSSAFLSGNQVSVITSSYARTPNNEVAPTAAAYRFSVLLPGTSAGADVNYVNMAFFR